MAVYRYMALEGAQPRSGTIEAASRSGVIDQLKLRGMIPLEVVEEKAVSGKSVLVSGYKIRDIARFARLFAILADSGIRPHDILEVLSKDMKNPRMRQSITAMAQDVGSGSSLYEAALRSPFLKPYAGLVLSGEKIGKIGRVMRQLSIFLEREAELADEIKGAITYPIVVMSVGILIIYFLFTGLVPGFASTLTDLGGELPFLTKLLMQISAFLRSTGFLIPLAVLAGAFAFRLYYSRPPGRLRVDTLLLRIPVIGSLMRDRAISKAMRTLAMLLEGGIPILEALETVSKSTGNAVYDQVFSAIKDDIGLRAKNVSEAFRAQEAYFTAAAMQQLRVGEQSSHLPEMMNYIAEDHEKESSLRARMLPKVIEPISIVLLGGMVGLIVAGLFLPLFNMINTLSRG
jgi:type IV pilus assembly protein PilC